MLIDIHHLRVQFEQNRQIKQVVKGCQSTS
ncbi:ABC transporter, ATP-binding protein [Proteus mirabilis]|uniref:ABC transporter, ATP-binding protein n=1 Tax=Proteus mirabilis TaxID=584 RepID=A0A2X2DI28_PROMI|nr:ABC transporter, ATP-binding protein [Proteus mirabilis]